MSGKAGELHFDTIDGLAHTPRLLDQSAYTDSHHAIAARLETRQRPESRGPELDGLGL